MIGQLPTSLNVNGKELKIRTDYRTCLLILQAFTDVELHDYEQQIIMLRCLYKDYDLLTDEDYEEAVNQAIWFLDCGNSIQEPPKHSKPTYDWQQDEQMIFSAINKVAGKEIRSLEYMHFWTFIGLFNEIGEGMFSSVVNIRNKKNKGKKLEKYEQEFYRNNKNIIDLKKKRTTSELEQLKILDDILNQ